MRAHGKIAILSIPGRSDLGSRDVWREDDSEVGHVHPIDRGAAGHLVRVRVRVGAAGHLG